MNGTTKNSKAHFHNEQNQWKALIHLSDFAQCRIATGNAAT